MFNNLIKQPLFTLLAVFGCIFIFAGFFKIDDITKWAISPLSPPLYPVVIVGGGLVCIAVFLFSVSNLSISTWSISNVRRLPNGYSVSRGSLSLNVLMGKIEAMDCSGDDCMIALPASEFFDDECINDVRSSLGAYMQHQFNGKIPEIGELIKQRLQESSYDNVEKEPGTIVPSYGVGKCIYLDRPLSSNHHIAIVSVTTKRANEGLQSDPRYLHNAIKSIQCEMANHRLTRLYVPVLGSGHGGLRGEVSLVCMLIAFIVLYRRQSGGHIKDVNIVVFRRDERSAPSISEKTIKRALAFASRLLED